MAIGIPNRFIDTFNRSDVQERLNSGFEGCSSVDIETFILWSEVATKNGVDLSSYADTIENMKRRCGYAALSSTRLEQAAR